MRGIIVLLQAFVSTLVFADSIAFSQYQVDIPPSWVSEYQSNDKSIQIYSSPNGLNRLSISTEYYSIPLGSREQLLSLSSSLYELLSNDADVSTTFVRNDGFTELKYQFQNTSSPFTSIRLLSTKKTNAVFYLESVDSNESLRDLDEVILNSIEILP
ncbi:hypothetical protein AB4163_08910 [Vibrio splendidus]|uniref:hypothetical protein n=1 Tax=unclassified Vibrio TaxID=2614977 RepID=UPI000EBC7D11|nr:MULTISPECIES: hypothetical protein [unclassified Vibrio]MBO7913184.1 hypothetical protein [Vibrio sp. G41H]MCF7490454.1 hypothetical protein [Vibrio sp. G-C-1]RIH71639.1 hypothetical protein BJG01_14155 [Vibrio splendidus]URM16187.1 hypothetical protein KLJ63_17935 [Vibrio splendidus]